MDEYDENDEDILSTQILPKNNEGNQRDISNADENTSLKAQEKEKQISESDKKEKKRLIDIFSNLKEELEQDENKTIDEIYEDYANNDDTVKNNISIAFKNNWSNKGYKILLYFMFIIVLPFFTILNLIGTYQMLSFMNIFYDAFKNYVTCYFGWEAEDEEYEFYNFYSYYFKESVNEGIDFDLMETMGFLGTILLNFSGFTVTSIFCLVINAIAGFLIFTFFNTYNGGKEKYSAGQIIFLLFCYLLLFIGVGSSALLSQQILIDNFYKFKLFLKENDTKKQSNNIELEENKEEEKEDGNEEKAEEDKEEKEDKKDISYFFLICTTSILGFFGKYILNFYVLEAKYEFDQNHGVDDRANNNTNFYDKINRDNETDNEINEIIFHHDKDLLMYILLFIYGGSIALSIIVYYLFTKIFDESASDEEDEENQNPRICQLFGYTIYSQNLKVAFNRGRKREDKETTIVQEHALSSPGINSVSRSETKKGKNLCQKILALIVRISCYCFECTKLLCDTLRSCCNEIVCSFFCCTNDSKNCCCCCCIPNMTNDDYEQKEQFFCYCYQSKRKMKWFNMLMRDKTQRKLMPVLLEYFILQLTTIGLEQKYSEFSEVGYDNFEDKHFVGTTGGIFLLSLLLFIYLTYSFGTIFNVTTTQEDFFKGLVESLSNKILNGTYGIIIFNGFYSFIFSILHFTSDLKNNNYLLIPIFMNKFYFFTFAHYCTIYTDEAEGMDLISCSTLIAIYLWIWDLIYGYASDTFNINVLFGIQIAVSGFIILAFLTLVSVFLCCLGTFWLTFLYLLSFLFLPFGGCWFCKCYGKYNCEKMSCCLDHKDACNNYQCIYLIFGKKFVTEKLSKIYLKN